MTRLQTGLPCLLTILLTSGCSDSAPPVPKTDPEAVKKLEREVEQIQKGGEGKRRTGG